MKAKTRKYYFTMFIREQINARGLIRRTDESEKKKHDRQDFDWRLSGFAPQPWRWPRVYHCQRRLRCDWRPSYREAACASENPIIFLPQDEYRVSNREVRAKQRGFDNFGWPGLKEPCRSTAEWSAVGHPGPGSKWQWKQTVRHKREAVKQKTKKRLCNNRFSNAYKIQWSMPENVSFN